MPIDAANIEWDTPDPASIKWDGNESDIEWDGDKKASGWKSTLAKIALELSDKEGIAKAVGTGLAASAATELPSTVAGAVQGATRISLPDAPGKLDLDKETVDILSENHPVASLPFVIGQKIKGFKESAYNFGAAVKDWAAQKEEEWFGGATKDFGPVQKTVYEGAKMAIPSLAPAATVGPVGTAILFAANQYQQTIENAYGEADKLRSEGRGDEAEKVIRMAKGPAGMATATIEGAGEYFGTKGLTKLFGVAEGVIKNRGARQVITDFFKSMGIEVSTEMGQAAGQGYVEKYTAIRPDAEPLADALNVAGPTIVLTALTGIGGTVSGAATGKIKSDRPARRSAFENEIDQALKQPAGPENAPQLVPEEVTDEQNWEDVAAEIMRQRESRPNKYGGLATEPAEPVQQPGVDRSAQMRKENQAAMDEAAMEAGASEFSEEAFDRADDELKKLFMNIAREKSKGKISEHKDKLLRRLDGELLKRGIDMQGERIDAYSPEVARRTKQAKETKLLQGEKRDEYAEPPALPKRQGFQLVEKDKNKIPAHLQAAMSIMEGEVNSGEVARGNQGEGTDHILASTYPEWFRVKNQKGEKGWSRKEFNRLLELARSGEKMTYGQMDRFDRLLDIAEEYNQTHPDLVDTDESEAAKYEPMPYEDFVLQHTGKTDINSVTEEEADSADSAYDDYVLELRRKAGIQEKKGDQEGRPEPGIMRSDTNNIVPSPVPVKEVKNAEEKMQGEEEGQGQKEQIAVAANEAATSPENDLQEPTGAQEKAGNYRKGHIKLNGLDISIENPDGSTRSGNDEDNRPWENTMVGHYGYIRRTEGKDGDQVDVFVNNDYQEDSPVFVVDQVNPKTKAFDEHKIMMGYPNLLRAKAGYNSNYEKGWKGLGEITEMPVSEFKEWLKSGDQKKPVSEKLSAPAVSTQAAGQAPKAASALTKKQKAWNHIASKPLDKLPIDLKTEKSKDLSRRARGVQPPAWIAKKFPEMAALFDRQDTRLKKRMKKVSETLKENKNFWKLKGKELDDLRTLVWKLEGEEVKGLGKKLKKTDDGAYTINEEHYKKYRKWLDKLNISNKSKDVFIDIRKSLDRDLATVINTMQTMDDIDPSVIDEFRRQIGNIHNYFPHMRYGDHYIEIKERETGKVVYREHFTLSDRAVLKATSRLNELKKEYPADKYILPDRLKKVRKLPEDVYSVPIPVDALEAVMNAAVNRMPDQESREAFRKLLPKAVAETLQSRGWGAHMIKRQGIPGHETENIKRVLFDYKAGLYGWLTKMEASRDFADIMAEVAPKASEKPQLWQAMRTYVKDMLENADSVDRAVNTVRGIFFARYLGGNVKTAFLNLTQNVIAGWPRLGMETGFASGKIISGAASDIVGMVTKGKSLGKDESRLLTELFEEGKTHANFLNEVQGQITTNTFGFLNKAMKALGWPMSVAERFNRGSIALAAFRVASKGQINNKETLKKYGLKSGEKASYEKAKRFAEEIVDDAHFVYGKGNRPEIFRGGTANKIASTAYTFRTFSHNLINLWAYMARSGRGRMAIMKSIAGTAALGGIGSVPLYKTFINLIQQLTGDDPEKEVLDYLGMDENDLLRDVTVYGLPALVGVNLGGSLGMELPVLERIKVNDSFKEMLGSATMEIAGIPLATLEDISSSLEAANSGQIGRSFEYLTPTVVANILKGVRLYREGATTTSGKAITGPGGEAGPKKLSVADAIRKVLGFQPTTAAKEWDIYSDIQNFIVYRRRAQTELANRFASAYHKNDDAGMKKAVEDLNDWNNAQIKNGHPEYVITKQQWFSSLRSRVRGSKTPKYMRGVEADMME